MSLIFRECTKNFLKNSLLGYVYCYRLKTDFSDNIKTIYIEFVDILDKWKHICLDLLDIRLEKRSLSILIKSSLVNSIPLNSFALSLRCAKSRGIRFLTYHSKSYQSRPFMRFFHWRKISACIFPAYRSLGIMHLVLKESRMGRFLCLQKVS